MNDCFSFLFRQRKTNSWKCTYFELLIPKRKGKRKERKKGKEKKRKEKKRKEKKRKEKKRKEKKRKEKKRKEKKKEKKRTKQKRNIDHNQRLLLQYWASIPYLPWLFNWREQDNFFYTNSTNILQVNRSETKQQARPTTSWKQNKQDQQQQGENKKKNEGGIQLQFTEIGLYFEDNFQICKPLFLLEVQLKQFGTFAIRFIQGHFCFTKEHTQTTHTHTHKQHTQHTTHTTHDIHHTRHTQYLCPTEQPNPVPISFLPPVFPPTPMTTTTTTTTTTMTTTTN